MVLTAAVQQTILDVKLHFENYAKEVSDLERENLQLKKLVAQGSHDAMVVQELLTEMSELKAQLAYGGGAPLPGVVNSVESVEAGGVDFDTSPEIFDVLAMKNRKSTEMVNDLIIQKHAAKKGDAREAEERASSAASNKFKALRSDPFAEELLLEQFRDKKETKKCTVDSFKNFFFKFTLKEANCIQKITEALFFKTLSIAAIGANTIYLGAAADFNVKNSTRRLEGLPKEDELVLPDIIFTCWFTFEIVLRVLADQLSFFVGDDNGWNLFDLALVSESVITLTLSSLGGSSGKSKLSFLRIFRCFRLVRVVRVVRSVKALAKLRTMIFAILNSFVDLLWALLVVGLIIFVFAIIFDDAAAAYFDEIEISDAVQMENAIKVREFFGDMGVTILSLWSAVSGGNDWMTYGEELLKIGVFYFCIFNFYIAFCVVGLFNVVTGVFVDSAVCVRTGDEIVAGYLEDLKSTTEEIKTFFRDADKDGSGSLSWEEFESHMKDPAIRAYFAGLEIDPEEASIIFTILDDDRSNEIRIDEFVHGTMKLKGSATKLDLVSLMWDIQKQNLKLDNLEQLINSSMAALKAQVTKLPTTPIMQPRESKKLRDLPRAEVLEAPLSRVTARRPGNSPSRYRR
eukprot:TRINITY_DN12167_c0_g1_i1.p1 TRINITY_DN12167_c0_g1~~TRINITY_DN12167_c0_g1_i1.p1  ORF type:complete len:641 (+),score=150.91 TRINITY_DN12167_c0_g1_i1:40-1923(+)